MDHSSTYSYSAAQPDAHIPPQENYAFLNRSTATVPHNLPPNADDRTLGRQKRKRTCAADQEVLEAAYKRDPKPDKAARLEIVKLVSLGEKEVQIWFQNRRQSSRRKSRPLLPHEIAQYQLARSEHPPQMYTPDEAADNEHDGEIRYSLDTQEEQPQRTLSLPPVSSEPVGELQSSAAASEPKETGEKAHSLQLQPFSVASGHTEQAVLGDRPQTASAIPVPYAANESHHIGYLANRRSAPSLRLSQTQQDASPALEAAPQPTPAPATADSYRRLKKASSYVRLSTSFDGKATVVTKDGSSPSPPRASQVLLPSSNGVPIAPLHLSAVDQASQSAARASLQRSSSGRSRDSRAWEFWCDKDARTELEDKAQKDSSGSAADAIGLLRSASGRSILGAIPAKRNSLLTRHPSEVKRAKTEFKRGPLQRSNTSLGRLQGGLGGAASSTAKPRPKLKYSESAVSVYIPGNDSDKENWSPEADIPHGSHPTSSAPAGPPVSGRAALGEKRNVGDGHAKRTAGRSMLKASSGVVPDSENADPEADPELAAFMGSARKSNSTSSEDDLDCVQGLLSLSQGNWR
ncbi:hypothetical protein LTR85_001424 [Meristemomyces frigidus]|nr:hypothetical protein LTR85_001424 [Meristemomyces frigidus]